MSAVISRVTVGRRRDGGPQASPTPPISWLVEASEENWIQDAAQVRVTRGPRDFVHDREDSLSVHVPWPFEPLESGENVSLSVRVRADEIWSPWSEPVELTAGFLDAGGWMASYIGLGDPESPAQPFWTATHFELDRVPHRAVLVAAAQGAYQGWVNGVEADDSVMKPGWTAYAKRIVHEWTDVTGLLIAGQNVLAFEVAGGWFTEEFGFAGHGQRVYGDHPSVAGQLILDFDDGSRRVIATDNSWLATGNGVTRASSIYQGERGDARQAIPDFAGALSSSAGWAPVTVTAGPVPQPVVAEPVRRMAELPVREVITTPSSKLVLDFGQNLVGRLRITVAGPEGAVITLKHAEVLEHGELGTRPLRNAAATDTFTLSGIGVETWEPRFTFHGFRFAQIDGWPGEFNPADVMAVVLHSDMTRTGWFESSHELVNRLHDNVLWSMRGNFLSLPTDCPQRDERLGWTGDIQVFAPAAAFLYDCDGFLSSWLEDLTIEQNRHAGIVPFVVPDVFPSQAIPAAAWGDAATIVPSVLMDYYGDRSTLARQWASMSSWSDLVADLAGGRMLWEGGFQFGDWLDPDAPADYPAEAKTAADIVASAYFVRSATLTARAARELGDTESCLLYEARADSARQAFLKEYVTPSGRMVSDSPTAYSLALVFEIAQEESLRAAMGARLAHLVRAAGYRLGTGFVGTPLILDALAATGHLAAAGRLVRQTANPSWLYAVTMGATTIWERWDSMLEDGSINPGEMTSFNHYAFGAVADWLHRRLAGLGVSDSGSHRLMIQPTPLDGFDFARAQRDTPYGRAEAGWQRGADNTVEVRAVVPANTLADVLLPDGASFDVGSGEHSWLVQLAEVTRPTITLDSTVGELVDHEHALSAVSVALEPHGNALHDFRRQVRASPDAKISEVLSMLVLTPAARPAVERALSLL